MHVNEGEVESTEEMNKPRYMVSRNFAVTVMSDSIVKAVNLNRPPQFYILNMYSFS